MKTSARLTLSLLAFSWGAAACGTDMEEGPGFRLEDPVADAEYPEVDTAAQGLGNGCRVRRIRIFNDRFEIGGFERDISIRSLSYWDATSGKYRSENVPNAEVENDHAQIYNDVLLENTEDHLVTSWRVHLKYEELNGDWSSTGILTIDTVDSVCQDGDTIGISINGSYSWAS